MKLFITLVTIVYLSHEALSKGLIEQFTWTRISYTTSDRTTRQIENRYGGSRPVKGGGRTQDSPVYFPGDTNSYGGGKPSGTGANGPGQSGGYARPSGGQSGGYARPSGQSGGYTRPNGQSGGYARPSGGQSGGFDGSGASQSSGSGQNAAYSGPNEYAGDFSYEQSNSSTSSQNVGGQNQGINNEYIYHPINRLNLTFSWNKIRYVSSVKVNSTRLENNIPMGANVWQDKLFITVPRRRYGVPSTLNYVSLNSSTKHNTPLIPYPDLQTNTIPTNRNEGQNRFVSVYRVAVDACDRLWFVDTGVIEIPNNPNQVTPTKLVMMDLNTDTILRTYEIPSDLLRTNTNLASLSIDTTAQNCNDAYAYMPDLGGYGLIVYSLRENRAWRVTHNYFFLEPLAGEFHIAGHDFQWNDGVFSTALTSIKSDGFRDLYFHSMAGTHQYKVSTKILKNETAATRSYHEHDFQVVGDRGPLAQTSASDLHKSSGILFLGLVNQNAVGCWNINDDTKDYSIVQKDDQTMIYPCDVKVYGDLLVVLTNTMPEFLYGQLDYDQINFRVWTQNVHEAVKGTRCASGGNTGKHTGGGYHRGSSSSTKTGSYGGY